MNDVKPTRMKLKNNGKYPWGKTMKKSFGKTHGKSLGKPMENKGKPFGKIIAKNHWECHRRKLMEKP